MPPFTTFLRKQIYCAFVGIVKMTLLLGIPYFVDKLLSQAVPSYFDSSGTATFLNCLDISSTESIIAFTDHCHELHIFHTHFNMNTSEQISSFSWTAS